MNDNSFDKIFDFSTLSEPKYLKVLKLVLSARPMPNFVPHKHMPGGGRIENSVILVAP